MHLPHSDISFSVVLGRLILYHIYIKFTEEIKS